jgi:osmoprotectant transport system ATP-binding protein
MLIGDMDPEMFHQPDLHFSVNTAPGMPSTGKNLRRARIGRGRSTQTFAKSAILSDMKSTAADDFAIEFRDVSYTSPTGQQVLSGLNLGVRRGQTLVLLGRSGSGKTTTLKLVNRLLSPTGGEVRVNGQAGGDVIRLRRSIGYVIQDVGLFPHFTVERNIALVPTIEGWPEERIRARVRDLLQIVGLEASMASRYPRQLSGGQRQRVGVARALAADPAILLMDEPFGALDPLTRDELQCEFLALQRQLSKTVVFVTHDLREALRLASRIALMEAGRLVTVLAPQDFLRSDDPWASAYVRAYGVGPASAASRNQDGNAL